jgi:hypothetical protein
MKQRYFLYLDILGFSDLAKEDSGKIDDLYKVIASLNAHHHHAFKVVVFSDTVIVYNVDGGDTPRDSSYLIMFMCEFVKDLMHRLTGREIYYRALITYGEFAHYELNGMPCFFGKALVDAYNSEKELKAVGLFIHKDISHNCKIFKYKNFNDNYNFVYVTQALDEIELFGGGGYPIPPDLIECTGSQWFIIPEISHVSSMYKGATNDNYSESTKMKYQASWEMYCKHYPNITGQRLSSNHDICSISPEVDWKEVFERFPEDHSYAIKTRKEF